MTEYTKEIIKQVTQKKTSVLSEMRVRLCVCVYVYVCHVSSQCVCECVAAYTKLMISSSLETL